MKRGETRVWAVEDCSALTLPLGNHVKITSFDLMDQTDVHNELLRTREWTAQWNERTFNISTCALDIYDCESDTGRVFLRLAPLPHSRPAKCDDFSVDSVGRKITVLSNGYPFVMREYKGGKAGRIRAFHALQRELRLYRSGRDGRILSNNWGGGYSDSKLNEDYAMREIEAAAKLGVEVVELDDGWQKGRSSNSLLIKDRKKDGVWNGFWAFDANFWDADPVRFSRGLAPLALAAKSRGMDFGLWFGPDSSNDAANWERDADRLIDYYRSTGIRYFKIDSMKSFTSLALSRQRKMFDKILASSHSNVVFVLDVTAEIRPGYFGLPDIGTLFVENRYAKHSSWWPHQTLRNIWTLSHVVDPVRLNAMMSSMVRSCSISIAWQARSRFIFMIFDCVHISIEKKNVFDIMSSIGKKRWFFNGGRMVKRRVCGRIFCAGILCQLLSASYVYAADGVSTYLAAQRAAKENGARAYVLDGLVAHWDGIENDAYGQAHVSTAGHPWKDLTGNRASIDTSKCSWEKNVEALYVSGYWNSPKRAVLDGTLPEAHTVEVCVRAVNSAGTGYILHGVPFFIISHNPNNNAPGLLYTKPIFGGYGLSVSSNYGGNYHFSPIRGVTYTVSHSGSLEDQISCYISGALTKKNTPKSLSSGSSEACLASNNSNSSQGINAYYYSIRIYNRVLSDDEIYWNSVVDSHRFSSLDAGCITNDGSSNPKSSAYSSALVVAPAPFDALATDGINFSSKAFRFAFVIR